MEIVKKPLPVIVTAVLIAAFAWNAFSANVLEQFVRFDRATNVVGALLRWASMTGVIAVPIALLYGRRDFGAAAVCFALPATLVSLAFTHAYFSVHSLAPSEIAAYWTSNVCLVAACAVVAVVQRGQKFAARSAGLAFLWCFAGCMPLNLFMQFPALMRPRFFRFVTFGAWHFASMLLFPLAAVGMYFGLRKTSPQARTVFLFGVSMALTVQLLVRFSFVRLQDYQTSHGVVAVLPLYLCSFAIAVLPAAIAARAKTLQTALFLIITPGSLAAIVYPAIPMVTSIFHYNITYFVLTHALLFAVMTQLPLSLQARPERAQLGKAAAQLGVYFVAVLLIENLVVAGGLGEPNFSYVTKCPLPLPLEQIGAVRWGWFRFSPLYLTLLYLTHFSMCLATYGVYRFLRRRAARRTELAFAARYGADEVWAEAAAAADEDGARAFSDRGK